MRFRGYADNSRYTWGPDGQVEASEGSALETVVFRNRHYILGQLLYQAEKKPQSGGGEEIEAFHVGRDTTIGHAGAGTLAQLSVNDYDFTGALISAHNAGGQVDMRLGTSQTIIYNLVADKCPCHQHQLGMLQLQATG